MTNTKVVLWASILWLFCAGLIRPGWLSAQTAPEAEKQKIEAMIREVAELKDARFIRNGATYGATIAVLFLRGKWRANDGEIKSARDFIDKVASTSGASGKPYLIRFSDGHEISSRDFLLARLSNIEARP
jgi:Family of unknown function (DUF5329)